MIYIAFLREFFDGYLVYCLVKKRWLFRLIFVPICSQTRLHRADEINMSKRKRITDFFKRPSESGSVHNNGEPLPFNEPDRGQDVPMLESETEETESKRKASNFQSKWLSDWPWLQRNEKGEMICTVCIENKMCNSFTVGCTNYRTSTLSRHADTRDHKLSLLACSQKKALDKTISKQLSKEENAIKSAIDCAYWLAKENVATDKYSSLLELLSKEGCSTIDSLNTAKNASYHSHSIADELQQAVADTLMADIVTQMKKALFISVMTDESTDISVCGKLILYVKFVDGNFDVHSHFLGNFDVGEKDASTITETLIKALSERGVSMEKVVCLGSDGASVMTGIKNGVAARLRKLSPFLVNIHCIAHRLALCTSQSAAKLDVMQQYKTTLTNLYYYFKGSSVRSSRLSGLQEAFNEPKLKMREMHDIRWFSFYNVLDTLYRTYNSLLLYFDTTELSKDPKATNLRNCLLQFKFAAMTWMLMDIIPIVTQLNLLFQRENLDISVVKPAVATAISKLKYLETNNGHYKREFFSLVGDSNKLFDHKLQNRAKQENLSIFTMNTFIENLISNLEKRFPADSMSVISSFECLAMRDLSFIAQPDLAQYGSEKLSILIEHYGKGKGEPLQAPILDGESAKQEYALLKELVLQQKYPRDNFNVLWKIIFQNHKDLFPNLIKLANIALALPVQTAICERGFSVQNIVKTSHRNRLNDLKLRTLMTIAIEGPKVKDFDATDALEEFKNKKQRRIFSKIH